MMHILQAQVYSCITAKKWKGETSVASKSQINQASWNRTVLKFDSENQLNIYNTVEFFFVIFPWSHDLEKVTYLSVWLGVRRTLWV